MQKTEVTKTYLVVSKVYKPNESMVKKKTMINSVYEQNRPIHSEFEIPIAIAISSFGTPSGRKVTNSSELTVFKLLCQLSAIFTSRQSNKPNKTLPFRN